MPDVFVLYIFLAVMVFNVLGTFIYLVGLTNFRASLRKAFRQR